MKKIISLILALTLALSLGAMAFAADTEEPVVVRLGLTGAFNEVIWDVVKEDLAEEGIELEYVQFNNFSLPNNALDNGEIEINAFQHHAFFNNDVASNGYDLTTIGDTYIVAMFIFSNKLKSLDEVKKGALVAVPNDVTNEGRALKVLESAGLITVDPEAGNLPTLSDITDNPLKLEFREVDANLVPSLLPDVAIAVVNGNYALDAGLQADEALYKEHEYADDSYYCTIAVRTEDADNPIYHKILEAYQSDKVVDVFNNDFAGFFIPTWTLDQED